MDQLSNEELMMMYQNGSEEAFQVLYQRCSPKIYAYLNKRLHNAEKVNEVFQEVFVKIHKSKNLYNKSFPVMPWIFTVTRSVLLDEVRKQNRQLKSEELNSDFALLNIQSLESPAISKLELLPEAQKTAIQMRYLDEKTFDEIATSLQTSSANVRQMISRGVKRLKQLIQEKDSK